MLKPLEYVYIDVVIGLYWNLNKWNRNIQTPILHSTMQLNIKITQSGFRLWFWPLTPGAFMSDKLRQLARGVIYGESEKVWKLSTTDTTHWHVSARLYIAQHWVQCSHSCSLHSSLQHLYFQARLLSTWRTPTLSCATSGPATKSFAVPAPKSSFSTIRLKLPRLATTALVQSSVFPSDNPTDSSSQVSRSFAILSTSSPVSSVKKSKACKPNYGNSLVVFTTLKNQTSLILTTSLATAKYTTGICLQRALIRASTLSKEIIHAVAATS